MNVKSIRADKKMLNIDHQNKGRAAKPSQPLDEQRREKRRIHGNDGDYAHAPAHGQTVKERLNKSENSQAAILLYAFQGLRSTARGWRESETQQRQKTHLKGSHQPPGDALKHHKHKRGAKRLSF